jgi:hypothetical protein
MNFNGFHNYSYSFLFMALMGVNSAVFFVLPELLVLPPPPFDRRKILSNLLPHFGQVAIPGVGFLLPMAIPLTLPMLGCPSS